MKKLMKEKNQAVPDEVLSKEFLSQFKTEADVSKFLKLYFYRCRRLRASSYTETLLGTFTICERSLK